MYKHAQIIIIHILILRNAPYTHALIIHEIINYITVHCVVKVTYYTTVIGDNYVTSYTSFDF